MKIYVPIFKNWSRIGQTFHCSARFWSIRSSAHPTVVSTAFEECANRGAYSASWPLAWQSGKPTFDRVLCQLMISTGRPARSCGWRCVTLEFCDRHGDIHCSASCWALLHGTTTSAQCLMLARISFHRHIDSIIATNWSWCTDSFERYMARNAMGVYV